MGSTKFQAHSQFKPLFLQTPKIVTSKMKIFMAVALAGLLALAVADDSAFELVETREMCTPPARAAGACKKEIERRGCRTGAGGKPHCTRIEDEEHEILETREGCRIVGPSKICTREVLKRETCHPGTGTTGPRCRRVMTPLEECRAGPGSMGPHCKRILLDAEERKEIEACRAGPGSMGPHCKRLLGDEYEEVETREASKIGMAGNVQITKREKCRPGPTGRPYCTKIEDEEHEIVVTREQCRPTAQLGPRCKRIFEKKEACKPGPTGRPYCN